MSRRRKTRHLPLPLQTIRVLIVEDDRDTPEEQRRTSTTLVVVDPREEEKKKTELSFDHVEPKKIKSVHIIYERAVMLTKAPHDRIGALGWAAITGFVGSIPGSSQD